jgi:hypothetical protein
MAEIVPLGQSEALRRHRRRRNALRAIDPGWPDDWPDCEHQTYRSGVELSVYFIGTTADPAALPLLVKTFDAAGFSLTPCDLIAAINCGIEAGRAPCYTLELVSGGSGVAEEEIRVMFALALEETGAPSGSVYTMVVGPPVTV